MKISKENSRSGRREENENEEKISPQHFNAHNQRYYVTSSQSLVIFRQRLVISDLLICSLLHCGPSNNFCFLGHTKNPDDDNE